MFEKEPAVFTIWAIRPSPYSDLQLDKRQLHFKEPLQVSVKVTNAGKKDGEEVLQLYLHDLVGSLTRPVKELKGFRKILLKAGETMIVTFTLTSDDLAFTNAEMIRRAEPGFFEVFLGGSSATELKTSFELVK